MRAVGHNTKAAIYAGISPHKNIIIWPHVAAQTNTETSIDQIINAARCLVNKNVAPNQIDREKGY